MLNFQLQSVIYCSYSAETPEAERQSVLFINFHNHIYNMIMKIVHNCSILFIIIHLYINVCYCKISIGAFPPNSQHIYGVPKNVPSVVG